MWSLKYWSSPGESSTVNTNASSKCSVQLGQGWDLAAIGHLRVLRSLSSLHGGSKLNLHLCVCLSGLVALTYLHTALWFWRRTVVHCGSGTAD